jgi:hypothetical protein
MIDHSELRPEFFARHIVATAVFGQSSLNAVSGGVRGYIEDS